MPKHTTGWEDGGIVLVLCAAKEAGTRSPGEPEPCAVCGEPIRLIWDVRLVEYDIQRSGEWPATSTHAGDRVEASDNHKA